MTFLVVRKQGIFVILWPPPIHISNGPKSEKLSKCPLNEIVRDETEDERTVDVEEFWESVEYYILARIFPNRVIQELKVKPSFNYWVPYKQNH